MTERQLPEQQNNVERVTLDNITFGIHLPKKIITNEDIEKWEIQTRSGLLTADDIQRRIGIKRRFIADPTESPIEMGVQAAIATENLRDVTAIIVSTSYPIGKNVSEEIGRHLQLQPKFHLDIHAACSGFVRALAYMQEHERKFNNKRVLLVATEKYSHTLADLSNGGLAIDPSMSQTIFSDGAVASVFEFGKGIRILGYENTKLPEELDNCLCMPINSDLMVEPCIKVSIPNASSGYLEQDGPRVFKAILKYVPTLNNKLVGNSGLAPSDIKLVIPHQASGRMIEGLKERMPDYTFFNDLEDGNFSSASIPKALMRAVREGKIQRGDKILLSAFGAGLYASSAIVELG